MSFVKKFLPERLKSIYREALARHRRSRLERREVQEWERRGRPIPPPHIVKQRIVADYGRKYGLELLVETGTFLGDMVYGCRNRFERIVSIELDDRLYRDACRRFESDHHVEIQQGDSGDLLPKILEGISEPCLFWLDGHYSAGFTAKGDLNTPIMDELSAICEHAVTGHVILIDDARCFTGEDDYPAVDEVRDFVLSKKSGYEFECALDIMRIAPPQEGKPG